MKKKLNTRVIKNIIMVLMIVALGVGAYFTMDYANNQSAQNSIVSEQRGFKGGPQGGGQNSNGKPPEMPSGDSQNSNGQPPEMPSGDNKNSNGQPPEMPSGNGDDPVSSFGNSTDNSASESENGNASDSSRKRPDGMPSSHGGKHNKSAKLNTVYYIVFAAESLLLAVLILYLIMSSFNKKGFRETLKGWKRIVIYVLSVAIVTTCLTVTAGAVTCKNMTTGNASHGAMLQGGPGGGMPGDSTNTSVEANGATSVDGKEATLSESYASSEADESAVLVTNGGKATLDGATITKTGDSTNTENSEFYGVNAAVLVQSGSQATIKGATIETNAKGANAVFATGEDAKIYVSDSTITSKGTSSARGLDATYGGYIEGDNVTVTTQGGSCAALATDRGGGTVTVKNSTLETNGKGSPVIYATGNISIDNTKGTANGSQMVVIEGKNAATVTNSTLNASGAGNRNDVDQAGIMIYQSMSGDASEGTGTFTATDSTLELQSGSAYYKTAPMFLVTNTDAVIQLKNTKLIYGSGVLLNVAGTSEWGNEGSNGGNVTLNAEDQTLTGDITADSISTVAITLTNSSLEGAVNSDNSAKEVTLTLDKDSRLTLTGDTYVTALDDADSTYSNINFGSYTLYVNGTAIN